MHTSKILSRSKFKFTESQFFQYRMGVMKKIPEISRSLDLLKSLTKKREEERVLKFQVNDGLFVEGHITKGSNTVVLWLGADTMVEYTYEEAIELLTANLKKAEYSVDTYVSKLAHQRTMTLTSSRSRSLAARSTSPEYTTTW